MKIVTKETLGKMPIGTVFTTWQPHYADEDSDCIDHLAENIIAWKKL